ncbi:Complex III assembly protein translocase and chaperone, partial [Teratosphaeriaceae sp. CCFEE 6253]
MDGDASLPAATPTVAGTAPASPRQDVVKQLAALGGGDGSITAQLLSNPFFTAGFGLAGLGAAVR